MKIISAKSYQDLSRKAANIISAQVILKPNCVLGLATGSTPIGTYRQLVEWYRKDDIDFSAVTTFNLDEYVGLSPEDPQSYHYFMRDNLFSHVNLRPDCCHVPDGCAPDLAQATGASISSFWASAATGTSPSTSRGKPLKKTPTSSS